MKNRPTVTIGIPALNEESNIGRLIRALLRQEQGGFVTEKILVSCEGSEDRTAAIVKRLQKSAKHLVLSNRGPRRGKASALNDMFSASKSDIFIALDADIGVTDTHFVKKLLRHFSNQHIGLVTGADLPVKPRTLVQKIANTWESMWFELRRDLNGGDTVHNCRGRVMALIKKNYKKLRIPSHIISDDDYIYFWTKTNHLGFRFAQDVIVYFNTPATLADFFTQTARNFSTKGGLAQVYGQWVYRVYRVPLYKKVKVILSSLVHQPILTLLALALQLYLRLNLQAHLETVLDGKWKPIPSTKEVVSGLSPNPQST